ncbi:hypothetical protein [Microvirga aerophila]|uniref:Adenylate cyclase n=1 Tax=Microvirga aerophila TaxID=670291 RepID=A0A512C109_9HYPH|nr:hypothetical protein [Microvirga aerophila]GEO17900.1 hypothetical protein MAE02_55960 [Microvirga aerophila]
MVLPFTNLSGDPDLGYFADGLTEDLTTDLSRLDGSFVIAGNTAFTYKNKPMDVRQIGRALGVRYVLEGSVRRRADLVRVNAQLIDAETGAHLWAERFDRPRSDLIEMQNEITAGIASTLRVRLVDIESRRGQRERPDNPDATDLAMRGWALIYAGQTRDNSAAARRLFEEALQIDPQVASTLTGLGFTHIRDVLIRWTDAYGDHLQRADELIERAIARKPDDAAAHQFKALLRRTEAQRGGYRGGRERCVPQPQPRRSLHRDGLEPCPPGLAGDDGGLRASGMRLSPPPVAETARSTSLATPSPIIDLASSRLICRRPYSAKRTFAAS